MSDQNPTAEDYARVVAELDEMKAKVARLEAGAASSYGDRIAAVVGAHLLSVEEILGRLADGVAGLNTRMDTVADRVAMARSEVTGVRSSLAEVVPMGQRPVGGEVEAGDDTPALEARAG